MERYPLEYDMAALKNGFAFQIIEQDDIITEFVEDHAEEIFCASNGWAIAIRRHPALDVENKVIYLRGDDPCRDLDVCTVEYLPQSYVNKAIHNINLAMLELVDRAKQAALTKVPAKDRVKAFVDFAGRGAKRGDVNIIIDSN